MLTDHIGHAFCVARDAVARVLLKLGLTPNRLTVLGCLVTIAAGACLAAGAFLAGGLVMVAAGACDMLDGALARQGNLKTPFGGFLDSTLDRISDAALYGGAALYFAGMGNRTYTLLAVMGLAAAVTISYARARAENLGVDARVGLFERGERFVVLMVAILLNNLPMALWLLGIHPYTTVLHRILVTRRGLEHDGAPIRPPLRPLGDLVIWNHQRGSLPYDLAVATYMALLLLARPPASGDVLVGLLARVF